MNDRPPEDPRGGQQGDHLDEHGCLDLLHGLLSSDEEEKILSHLAVCPACERLLRERAADVARRKATRVLRFLPQGELAVEKRGTALRIPEHEKHRSRGIVGQVWRSLWVACRRPRFQLAAGLAVVAAVFLLILWPHDIETPEAPGASGSLLLHALPSYSFRLQPREVPGTGPRDDLMAGLAAYDSGDFEGAVEVLRRAREPGPEGAHQEPGLGRVHQMVRDIYLGSALARMGKYEEVVEVLGAVSLLLVPDPWGSEARWTLYVALTGCGRETAADSLLRLLVREPGEVGERARRLEQR